MQPTKQVHCRGQIDYILKAVARLLNVTRFSSRLFGHMLIFFLFALPAQLEVAYKTMNCWINNVEIQELLYLTDSDKASHLLMCSSGPSSLPYCHWCLNLIQSDRNLHSCLWFYVKSVFSISTEMCGWFLFSPLLSLLKAPAGIEQLGFNMHVYHMLTVFFAGTRLISES